MNTGPELRLILATRAAGLPPELAETGFVSMPNGVAIDHLENAGLWFGPRRILEETEEFRQVIPYIVLCVGNRIVRYKRTPVGGEKRLHGQLSLGVGGHVDLGDGRSSGENFDLFATIEQASEREIREELGDLTVSRRRWIGLLVDNDNPVGRVHIGLIGIWHIDKLPDRVAEDTLGEVTTVSLSELAKDAGSLETWSAILLPRLQAEMANANHILVSESDPSR
ncbi:Predicted phosphoesterase, NUDIX family [Palleronia marisminoris]|uniref:Nudix hydrolase domain-containing protein n=1 Tax=Palleronia marisminoris TaxID=315423 RepID=A0A1Y5TTA3_9RHOB|nr:hypothetical protein [Palleronia marisminoris]SFH52730.1 Predicted phosphoesterase, NUDIX family [Palleronia marisminoris]SLN71631.1 hypothetical protein PAM7066_03678 [Palleronia marisminoris]